MVLPRQEADAYRKGGGGITVTVSGNQFTVREDADVDKIALKIAQEIERVVRFT